MWVRSATMYRTRRWVVQAMAASAAVTACGDLASRRRAMERATEPASSIQSGGILKTMVNYDTTTFDPIASPTFTANVIGAFVYNRLFWFPPGDGKPPTGEIDGDLVASYEQPDLNQLVLKLRPNAKWDARPPTSNRSVDSEDVTKSWEYFVQRSAYRVDLAHSANPHAPIETMTAPDPSTVVIKTAIPYGPLTRVLASDLGFWVVPKEGLAGQFDLAKETRGSGPWVLDQYQPGVRFSFKKNPHYFHWPQYPLLDGVELAIIKDAAQAEAQFIARSVWFNAVPAVDTPNIKKANPSTLVALFPPSTDNNTLSFGYKGQSPFKDQRVRQAVSMLIDRKSFIDTFQNVSSLQAAGIQVHPRWNTIISCGYEGYWVDPQSPDFGPNAKYYKLNVAEAKKLLTAAGYPDGFDTMLTYVSTGQYGLDWSDRAQALIGMLAQAGIRAKPNPADYTSIWVPQYLRAHGNFDGMALYPNGSRADPAHWFAVFLASWGANNQVGQNFPELDHLILKQQGQFDEAARRATIKEIQQRAAELMPMVPAAGWTETLDLYWPWVVGRGRYQPWMGTARPFGRDLFPLYAIDSTKMPK